jgi:multimeric flavodoxin WrbA
MQDIYAKLLEADGIIFGTPVYFWSASAQAKALIDRTYVFSPKRKLRNKAAGVVVTTARMGSTSAVAIFNSFFTIQKMLMVGRAVGFSGEGGYSDKEAVKEDEQGMAQAEALGETMFEFIQSHKIPG